MFRLSLAIAVLGSVSVANAEPIPAKIQPGQTAVYTVNGHKYALHMPAVSALAPPPAGATVDTHVIFMNRCKSGCRLNTGSPNSIAGTTDLINRSVTVPAFAPGNGANADVEWAKVMTCMKNTFSRFNVTITDVDPGSAPHLEIVTSGTSAQIMGQDGILGVADYACSGVGQGCSTFHSNTLVFDFANDPAYYQPMYKLYGASDICATAAQEIAHTWALDHVTDPTDPLTYAPSDTIRQFKDAQKCGSDCNQGQSPLGLTCSGSNDMTSTHTCMLGTATQDEVKEITQLFGAAPADTTAPTVSITSPASNASVMPGFTATATAMDNTGIANVELALDGASLGVVNFDPFTWTAPSSLTKGPHTLVATATDFWGNKTTATQVVAYGKVCSHDGDCDSGQVCDDGVCVAGPTVAGGLGSVCTQNSDCESMSCGSDGTAMYCVTACDPNASGCPGGFTCLQSGAAGVCWPGDNGGGGCSTSGSTNTPLFLFGLGALFFARRRRG